MGPVAPHPFGGRASVPFAVQSGRGPMLGFWHAGTKLFLPGLALLERTSHKTIRSSPFPLPLPPSLPKMCPSKSILRSPDLKSDLWCTQVSPGPLGKNNRPPCSDVAFIFDVDCTQPPILFSVHAGWSTSILKTMASTRYKSGAHKNISRRCSQPTTKASSSVPPGVA